MAQGGLPPRQPKIQSNSVFFEIQLETSSLVKLQTIKIAKSHTADTTATMRFLHSLVPSLLFLAAGAAQAASSWSFEDGTVSVTSKKAGAGGGVKEK